MVVAAEIPLTAAARSGKEPLRVLFFLPDLDLGGAQRTVVNLVNNLPRTGVLPMLAAARANGPGREWLAKDINFVDLAAGRLRGAPLPLRRLITATRPNLVFATIAHANVVATLATLGLSDRPAVVLRETNSHRHRPDLSWASRAAIAWAYRRADAVVALSRGVGRELTESYGLEPTRVVTIHNPVEVEHIAANARAAIRPWTDNAPVVVGLGRLVAQKGFDLLLRAFAAAAPDNARLVIIGDGPDRDALQHLAGELGIEGRVGIRTSAEDIAPWLTHAAMFVLSSRWEGFGHVIVEAMASGTPVIAADCPYGPTDIVRHEQDGLLVPANIGGLTDGMKRLFDDPALAKRLGAAGIESSHRFSADRIAARYADLFHRLCGAKEAP